MSLVLFYFSGTGNTRYIARRICDTLNEHGYEATAISIENLNSMEARIQIDNSSVVGLGWPIYGSDIPAIMQSFIKSMPIADGKPLLTFCTQMAFSGDGAVVMRRQLESKGYVQKWAMQFNMPNNVSVKGIPLSVCDDYAMHEEKYLKTAREKADNFAFKVLNNVEDINGATIFNTIAAMSQRPAFKYLMHDAAKKKIGVNDDCNGCGMCVQMCPKNVFKLDSGKAYRANVKECTLCLRCTNFCPQGAVTVFKSVKKPLYKGPDKETYSAILNDKRA